MVPLALCVAVLTSGAVTAQIVPGVVPPDSAKTAMVTAQMIGCTFAASGRPSPFSSNDTTELIGVTYHSNAPIEILTAVGMSGEDTLAFTIENPEGEVWVINEPDRRRCAIATAAGDLAAAEALFTGDYEQGIMEYREIESGESGSRRYRSRPLRLTVTLISSNGPDDPFVVITEPTR